MGRKPVDLPQSVLNEVYQEMTPTIFSKNIDLDLNRVRTIRLYFVYDIHYGAKTCFKRVVEDIVQKVKSDPYGYLVLGGDMCEFINNKDKRFNPSDVDTELLKVPDNLVGESIEKVYKWFAPVKEKILIALTGNHELAMAKHHGTNPVKVWVDRWNDAIVEAAGRKPRRKHNHIPGVIYGGYECVLLLRINNDSKHAVSIYMSHGWGGGRLYGSKVNRILEMMYDFPNANMYISGHSHAPIQFPKLTHSVNNLTGEFDAQVRWFVRAPALKLSKGKSPTQYEKIGGYHTSPMGYTVLNIRVTPEGSIEMEPRLKVT